MGNRKSICVNHQEELIYNKPKTEQNSFFFISYGLKSLTNYLDNVQNEIKINIDFYDEQCFTNLKEQISNITEKVTSLSLKSTLQTKLIFPIEEMLIIFKKIAQKNYLNLLSIRFEFIYLKQKDFQQLVQYIKEMSNLTILDLRLNNDLIDQFQFDFLNCQSLCLTKKNNLKQLDLLFSFKNIRINKQNFETHLDAFSQLTSLENFTIAIENTIYSDASLDIIYSLIKHENLQTIFIDILQQDFQNEKSEWKTSNFLKFEENKKYITKSNLKNLEINKLRQENSHILFSLASNLPKLQTLSLTLLPQMGNKEKPFRKIQEFSTNKKYLDNLTIQIEFSIMEDYFYETSSYFDYFVANSFQFLHYNKRSFQKKSNHSIEKYLLSVCWNQVQIGDDSSNFQTIKKYLAKKTVTIAQYIVFQKNQKQFMLCNPQLIFLDLYMD